MSSDTYDDSGTVDRTARMPPFDPMAAVLTGHAAGRAIPPGSLTADRLRRVFAAPAPWQPEHTDEARRPRFRAGTDDYVPASVLVPIVLRADAAGPTILLTERTAHLNAHAGQVSFPGGSAEAGDADAVATALRETEEEIGLARRHVEVIGRLTEYLTVTGFEVPLTFVLDPANHERRRTTIDGETRAFTAMPHGGHFIWGATAAMLRNLYLLMAAQPD
jgi:8-oxo-dGTP pyrophosphatase MutT (NUDIX family)